MKNIRPPKTYSASQWNKLSVRAKRTAIARDVVYRAEIGQVTPTRGHWVLLPDLPGYRFQQMDKSLQMLLKKGEHCQCCALGGAICGLAVIENKLSVGAATFGGKTRQRLIEIFGNDNLNSIEFAFEKGNGAIDSGEFSDYYDGFSDNSGGIFVTKEGSRIADRAKAFGLKYITERNRFLAIWKNVLKHRGSFIP